LGFVQIRREVAEESFAQSLLKLVQDKNETERDRRRIIRTKSYQQSAQIGVGLISHDYTRRLTRLLTKHRLRISGTYQASAEIADQETEFRQLKAACDSVNEETTERP
jgi:hypothetical protein